MYPEAIDLKNKIIYECTKAETDAFLDNLCIPKTIILRNE
jgi:hypothetical protein